MSAIDAATGVSGPASATDAFEAMSSEDFVEIMFTELTNQDPLSPNETNDLLQQISALRSIESDQALGDKLEEISRQNQVTSAGTLIGKLATGLNESGNRVVGFVDSISISREGVTLNLNNGNRLPFDNLDEVIDPTLFADPDDGQIADETPVDGVDEPAPDDSGGAGDDPPADEPGDDQGDDDGSAP